MGREVHICCDKFIRSKTGLQFQACLPNAKDDMFTSEKVSCSTMFIKYSLRAEHEIKQLTFPLEAQPVFGNQAVHRNKAPNL